MSLLKSLNELAKLFAREWLLQLVMGRAWDLKVGLGPGPGLSPCMNAGPWALTGLEILLYTAVKKLEFSGPSPKVGLLACSGLGPSPKVGLWAFQKTRASGRA